MSAALFLHNVYNQRGLLTMLEHSMGKYNYSHDQNGNITGIVGPNSSHNYTYAVLNQLHANPHRRK